MSALRYNSGFATSQACFGSQVMCPPGCHRLCSGFDPGCSGKVSVGSGETPCLGWIPLTGKTGVRKLGVVTQTVIFFSKTGFLCPETGSVDQAGLEVPLEPT